MAYTGQLPRNEAMKRSVQCVGNNGLGADFALRHHSLACQKRCYVGIGQLGYIVGGGGGSERALNFAGHTGHGAHSLYRVTSVGGFAR